MHSNSILVQELTQHGAKLGSETYTRYSMTTHSYTYKNTCPREPVNPQIVLLFIHRRETELPIIKHSVPIFFYLFLIILCLVVLGLINLSEAEICFDLVNYTVMHVFPLPHLVWPWSGIARLLQPAFHMHKSGCMVVATVSKQSY